MIALITRIWRKGASLFLVGLIACGGDDDDSAVASDNGGNTTTSAAEDDMNMHGNDAPDMNPCAMGGTGEMPGMESMAPAAYATAITITAEDYKFSGTGALKDGGQFAVTFENKGKELHELHIAKLPDGEERSMEEFFKDPDAESMTTTVGSSFACPGTTANAAGVDLSEAGRYVVACFIPTGATPEVDPKDWNGPPHAMQGMAVEIDIK